MFVLSQKLKGVLGILGLTAIVILIVLNSTRLEKKENELYQNQKLTFCIPYKYESTGSRGKYLSIKYKLKSLKGYYDSKNRIDEKNVQLNHYYPAIYNRKDSLHSLLLINEKPINPIAQIVKNSFVMYGRIDSCYNAYNASETYISYIINHQKYSFRTRIDSTLLPNKTIKSSIGKKIKIKVSKTYFQLNNLYLLSYDRVPNLKETYNYTNKEIELLH